MLFIRLLEKQTCLCGGRWTNWTIKMCTHVSANWKKKTNIPLSIYEIDPSICVFKAIRQDTSPFHAPSFQRHSDVSPHVYLTAQVVPPPLTWKRDTDTQQDNKNKGLVKEEDKNNRLKLIEKRYEFQETQNNS